MEKENSQVGKTKDAGFQIGVRRTLPIEQTRVWDFLFSNAGLKIWLGKPDDLELEIGKQLTSLSGQNIKITVLKPYSHIRMRWQPEDWDNYSLLQLRVIPNGKKTIISFHQDHLAGPEQRGIMKIHWTKIINDLSDALDKLL